MSELSEFLMKDPVINNTVSENNGSNETIIKTEKNIETTEQEITGQEITGDVMTGEVTEQNTKTTEEINKPEKDVEITEEATEPRGDAEISELTNTNSTIEEKMNEIKSMYENLTTEQKNFMTELLNKTSAGEISTEEARKSILKQKLHEIIKTKRNYGRNTEKNVKVVKKNK